MLNKYRFIRTRAQDRIRSMSSGNSLKQRRGTIRQGLRRRQEKVFQASESEAGARFAAKLFSIIRTAIINGLDPYRYLEYAIENVGKKPIGDILPYSKDLEIR